jgi:hypothetical protein
VLLQILVYVLVPNLKLLLCMICTLSDNIIFAVVFFICKNNNNNYYRCSVSLNLSQFLHYMMDFVEIWYGKLWNYHLTPHSCVIVPRHMNKFTNFLNESGDVCTKSKLLGG